jgi:hypothetical protein
LIHSVGSSSPRSDQLTLMLWACGKAEHHKRRTLVNCSPHSHEAKEEVFHNPHRRQTLDDLRSPTRPHLLKALPPAKSTSPGTKPLTHGPFRDIQHPIYSRDQHSCFLVLLFLTGASWLCGTRMMLYLLSCHLSSKKRKNKRRKVYVN